MRLLAGVLSLSHGFKWASYKMFSNHEKSKLGNVEESMKKYQQATWMPT
jgi:hypothetical protein